MLQNTTLWDTGKANITIIGGFYILKKKISIFLDDLKHFYARPSLDPAMKSLFLFSF